MFAHQLERAVALQLTGIKRRKVLRAFIDAEKNKLRMRSGLSTFPPQQVFEALLASPKRGKKRNALSEVQTHHQDCPKYANRTKDRKSMAPEPMHASNFTTLATYGQTEKSGRASGSADLSQRQTPTRRRRHACDRQTL